MTRDGSGASGEQPREAAPEVHDLTRARPPSAAEATRVRTPSSQAPAASAAPVRSPPTGEHEVALGDVIAERFVIEQLLGRGGMGAVYVVLDRFREAARDPKPRVALKVLHREFAEGTQGYAALQREVRRSQELAHPNIVICYDFAYDRAAGVAFATMELLEGHPLDALLRLSAGGLPPEQARRILHDLAAGLGYAHASGWVHADLKPANVFVTADGAAKILDFGIARAAPGRGQGDEFDAGLFGGLTERYASPEMLAGETPQPADDVFALGLMGCELYTGRHPFAGRRADEAAAQGLKPLLPKQGSRAEQRALVRALRFARAARWPDAGTFARAIRGVSRRLQLLGFAAVAAVLALAAVAGVVYEQKRAADLRARRSDEQTVKLESLSAADQARVRENIASGNEALALYARSQNPSYLNDAVQHFSIAYDVHERDPDAVAGLEKAIGDAVDWTGREHDRARARELLASIADQCAKYCATYTPLQDAIHSLPGS